MKYTCLCQSFREFAYLAGNEAQPCDVDWKSARRTWASDADNDLNPFRLGRHDQRGTRAV